MKLTFSQLYLLCWFALIGLTATACGLSEPQYEPYEIEKDPNIDSGGLAGDDGTADADGGDPCAAALTAWEANMKSIVDQTCSTAGCHAGQSSLDLNKDADEANRASLSAWIGGDTNTMTDVIHGSTHQGGNFTSQLPADSIQNWHTAESECQ